MAAAVATRAVGLNCGAVNSSAETSDCTEGSGATSVDAAIPGRTDWSISRISLISRRRSATVASAVANRVVGMSGDAVTSSA